MKRIFNLSFAVLMFTSGMNKITAQEFKPCYTSQMIERSLAANPELRQEYEAEQQRLEALDKAEYAKGYGKSEGSREMQATVYIIPIVFHIIHQNGAENISDAQIRDAVRILNNDYRKKNSDTTAIVSAFRSIAADCSIEFRLAQKDPSGNCTNGIDRIFSSETNVGDDGSKLNDWPRNKYLNVWVVKAISSGAAGYAYLPGTTMAANDGVMILSTYIGSIGTGNISTSRALTHEIGHFLNLQHTWGGSNTPAVASNCSTDDGVTDTPNTEGWTSCNLSGATCTSPLDNVQNYMDYSYCSNMFTQGQSTRMRAALNSATGQRSSLWTTTNLTATGVSTPSVLCSADFQSSVAANTVCQGNSLTFTDISWNGNPTSWSWTFPGGSPSTSTDSTPSILYNTPGVYDVSLTVSNASGSVSATKTGYITVNPSTASFTGTIYTEGFEGAPVPNTTWVVRNQSPGGNTWVQTSTAAATGSKCVKIDNLSTYDTYVDELIGPSIDMNAIAGSTPTMTFKYAYAQRVSTNTDKLQVYVSTTCGLSWSLRKTISGTTLTTGGVVTGTFVPNASQWATQSAILTGYATQPNLYYMFRFTSNGGNNIYLDDINISGTVTTGIEDVANSIDFNIFPNPIEENTVISFNLLEKQKIDIKVLDVLGREVSTVFNGPLNEGEHTYKISDNGTLSSGIYFVKVSLNDKSSFSKKLIVN
jgi:PKD repeat protein